MPYATFFLYNTIYTFSFLDDRSGKHILIKYQLNLILTLREIIMSDFDMVGRG